MSSTQVATVSFQGMVVAFARADAPPSALEATDFVDSDVYYNVLSLEVDSSSDASDWDGWRRLQFPNEVRPSGMELINVPFQYSTTQPLLRDAGQPFRVITNQEYVYVLRQAVGGTILVNRFRLVRQLAPGNAQEVEYVLQPAWEVRFQRSGKPDVPYDPRDVQSYLSPDREPFIEPALELPLASVSDGNFDAVILPRDDGSLFMCTVAVRRGDVIDVYELPLDASGRFLLAGKGPTVAPDLSFGLTDSPTEVAPHQAQRDRRRAHRDGDPVPFTLSGRPALTYYLKQERVAVEGEASFLVRRSGRLLLAVRAQRGTDPVTLATVDLGLAADGTLARPTPVLAAAAVGVAPYTLDFDSDAHVTLADMPLAGAFGLDLWIYPRSSASPQLVLGNPGDARAPALSIVDGSKLQVSFTDGNGAWLTALTGPGAVYLEAWAHVLIDFDPAQPVGQRYVVRVNGEALPHTEDGTGTIPSHANPITSISAATGGFVGSVDSVAIYAGTGFRPADLVGSWPLDTVQYVDKHGQPINPPTTPNAKDPSKPAQVFGAHLVPSTSPAATGAGGALTWDARGLSIVTGYFADLAHFTELRSSPALLASADGLVHVYFQGSDDRFSVMQLDVESARAIFQSGWTAAAGPAQTGALQFVAAQSGSAMNGATITITDPQAGLPTGFCDVVLASPSKRIETWRGVPRSLAAFTAALDGATVSDPGDPRLQNGAVAYYDAAGARTAAYVALTGSSNAALVAFVARQPGRLPLALVDVTAQPGSVDLVLSHTAPRWSGVTLTQTWRALPAQMPDLMATLDGTSTTYGYHVANPSNVRCYSIGADGGVMDADTVLFFTHPDVGSLDRLVVRDGSEALRCDVDLTMTISGVQHTATWTEVSRLQTSFATTIQGDDLSYDYAHLASGDYAAIGAALVLTTNGAAADVDNVSLTAPTPEDDLRVYGTLFEAFTTAPVSNREALPTASVAAVSFQRATASVDGVVQPIAGPSLLFRAMPATQPNQGSVGLVDNTAALTDGTARLLRQGLNGGWRNSPDARTLGFDWGGYVGFKTNAADAPNIAALTVQGDLTLELWCRPRRSTRDKFQPNQRLVTFARTPPATEGGERVRFLAGLQDVPSVRFNADTTLRAGYVTNDGTFYTWFSPLSSKGALSTGTIGSLATLGLTAPVISISIGGDAKVHVDFLAVAGSPTLVAPTTLVANEWYQLALPWRVTRSQSGGQYTYTFDVDMYLSGVHVGHQTWTTTPSPDEFALVTMVLGEIAPSTRTTALMYVNEAAFFARPLRKGEISQFSEQRVPDNARDLIWKWMLDEGTGSRARNSAATGAEYDGDVKPSATWEKFGLYQRPTLGHGDNLALLKHAPIIQGWSHLALVHQAGHALRLLGSDYADCGHEQATQLGDKFSIEAWAEVGPVTGPRTIVAIVSKGLDYELGLTQDLKPRFAVRVTISGSEQTFELRGASPVTVGEAHYYAVTYELVTKQVGRGTGGFAYVYEVHIDLWADGQVVASGMKSDGAYVQFPDIVERVSTSANLNLARTARYGGSRYLTGYLSDTRVWSRVLSASEIQGAAASRRSPPDHNGLVSWWRFDEAGGRTCFDVQGNTNARLNRGDLRTLYQPTSANAFYVNGESAAPTWVDGAASVGGYPADDTSEFSFAQLGGDYPIGFYGQLDQVRLWRKQLTTEQLTDSMNAVLSGGERDLVGLWSFDNGSGPVVQDLTGRGNNGELQGSPLPVWSTSTAPLGNEAEGVINVLGGVATFAHDVISETPSVLEYGDVQRDAYGAVFSVMKRAYVSIDGGDLQLVTGYKVGDLQTIYLGQAQSRPSVIGVVEGAPPIPSENQTMPHWVGGGTGINGYAGASSVTFEEADQTTYVFNATRETSNNHKLAAKAGLAFGDEVKSSVGVGAEVENMVYKYEGKVGPQGGFEFTDKSNAGSQRSAQTAVRLTTGLKPSGAWEPGTRPEDWVNPTVGRRFVPANTGLALVKSLTVDVYASILATTRTMVKVTQAPNPDIPEDVNLLPFPIDPRYVKNGTLDGKVGLANDPSYPNADLQRGSYFKPLEAYALKRRIEREQARLAGYYDQYDVGRLSSRLRSSSSWDDYRRSARASDTYDWPRRLSKRNLVNTYVWSASGGTYAEQTSTMDVYTESYGAVSASNGNIGAVGELKMTFPVVGFFVELDYLYTWGTEVNVVKSREDSASFSLSTTAEPDPFLYAPKIAGTDITFASTPTEGKVDGYRYLAFYLAPTTENFTAFRDDVVDQNWLHNSLEPAAVALREATAAANGAWRVLYRVTYVSRIPPRFQPAPVESQGPDLEPPANQDYNALLIALVDRAVGKTDPTPIEVGAAITQVIGSPAAPGPLATLLPWWQQFLTDAGDYRLPAAGILRTLREDLLRYMLDTYATRQAVARG
jgi:hypothetical protein